MGLDQVGFQGGKHHRKHVAPDVLVTRLCEDDVQSFEDVHRDLEWFAVWEGGRC